MFFHFLRLTLTYLSKQSWCSVLKTSSCWNLPLWPRTSHQLVHLASACVCTVQLPWRGNGTNFWLAENPRMCFLIGWKSQDVLASCTWPLTFGDVIMSRAVSYGDLLTSKDKISNNVHMTTKFCHQLIVIMYFWRKYAFGSSTKGWYLPLCAHSYWNQVS